MNKLRLFTGRANKPLAKKIAEGLGWSLGEVTIKNFKDGETWAQLEETVRDMDVFIIQSLCSFKNKGISFSVNDSLMELLILIDAARRASARRITAVIPYFAYARQEKKTTGREPISARLVADMISKTGADQIVTMDLHSPAIEGFFDIPVDNLPLTSVMTKYFQKISLPEVAVAAPDAGGVNRANNFRHHLSNQPSLAIVIKRRPKPEQAEVIGIVGEVEGKSVVLVDDIISTGNTLIEATRSLLQKGAKEVYACATHPVFAPGAVKNLQSSPIKKVVITDTLPLNLSSKNEKFEVVSVAPLLARAIKLINKGEPITGLYGND